jgi:hypothetical protein
LPEIGNRFFCKHPIGLHHSLKPFDYYHMRG